MTMIGLLFVVIFGVSLLISAGLAESEDVDEKSEPCPPNPEDGDHE